jgi:hypothetical protein
MINDSLEAAAEEMLLQKYCSGSRLPSLEGNKLRSDRILKILHSFLGFHQSKQ